MNYFIFSAIFNGLTSAGVALLVFLKNRKHPTNRWFVVFSASVAFWSLGYFFWQTSTGYDQALFWIRFAMVGSIVIPVAFSEFVIRLVGRNASFRALRKVNFTVSAALLCFSYTSFFISGVRPIMIFSFWPTVGFLFYVFHASFAANVVLPHILMFREWQKKPQRLRKQIEFVFIATVIGFTGGMTNHFLWYGIKILPFGNIAISICVLVMAYAIVTHHLMDTQVIVKKTLVFAGLVMFVFGAFSGATLLVQELLSVYFKVGTGWVYVISLFLIVLGYDPIRNWLVNLTDKYLFQKKYDYQKLLKDASKGMSRIESLDHLMKLVVHFITMKMRVRNAGVLTRRHDSDYLVLYHQRGYRKNYFEYRISISNPLIEYLIMEKEALDLERIKEHIEFGKSKDKKEQGEKLRGYDYKAIEAQMEELEAVCCVPSFLGHELRNVLILGEKKSGVYYAEEDLNVLFTLAQESAIAIENARLFDEAVNKSHELEKINDQLEYSRGLLMKALKQTEVANKQLQDTQAQLIHEQKMATLGRLAASVGHEVNNPLTILSMNVSRAILKYRKNPGLKVEEILELFEKMEQNIGRIKAVVNTLTGLLKRSEKGKFEPLSLKLILEETLPLVQFQTYLDNLTGTDVEFDVPGNIPLIRGDLERLQEVFLNLFINAYHAMEGKRNRQIRVSAEIDPENSRQVIVSFADNGSGMTDEVMKKAFTYGFTTKGPGKGSGMGLYMCKYIIELHGGDMKVKSKVGEGTTFILTLPAYEESGYGTAENHFKATS